MNKSLKLFLLGYTLATTIHFFHNAVFLSAYPNMPEAISQLGVYAALAVLLAIGAIGYFIYNKGHRVIGLLVIAIYAAFGFDGLAHYTLAPVSSHSVAMNVTIWTEVVMAAFLFASTLILLGKSYSTRKK